MLRLRLLRLLFPVLLAVLGLLLWSSWNPRNRSHGGVRATEYVQLRELRIDEHQVLEVAIGIGGAHGLLENRQGSVGHPHPVKVNTQPPPETDAIPSRDSVSLVGEHRLDHGDPLLVLAGLGE